MWDRTREQYVSYVNKEWYAQLAEYLSPEERFSPQDSAGLVLFSFSGKHLFIPEQYKPEPTPAELEADRIFAEEIKGYEG